MNLASVFSQDTVFRRVRGKNGSRGGIEEKGNLRPLAFSVSKPSFRFLSLFCFWEKGRREGFWRTRSRRAILKARHLFIFRWTVFPGKILRKTNSSVPLTFWISCQGRDWFWKIQLFLRKSPDVLKTLHCSLFWPFWAQIWKGRRKNGAVRLSFVYSLITRSEMHAKAEQKRRKRPDFSLAFAERVTTKRKFAGKWLFDQVMCIAAIKISLSSKYCLL